MRRLTVDFENTVLANLFFIFFYILYIYTFLATYFTIVLIKMVYVSIKIVLIPATSTRDPRHLPATREN